MRVLGNRILVKEFEVLKSKSGLAIPKGVQENRVVEAEVVEVGEGMIIEGTSERIPIPLKKGDKIFYAKHYAMDINGLEDGMKIVDMSGVLGCKD